VTELAVGPNGKPLDPCWETLVEETHATPEIERGALNTALRAIRAACERDGIHPDDVPQEIRLRAEAYRRAYAPCALTPMALAKHWRRVMVSTPTNMTVEEQTLTRLRSASHGPVTL
jgi:hypothetical protein